MAIDDRVCAVVVARAGNGPKRRLAGILSLPERQQLVRAMLADVLAVCAASPEVDDVIVVTDLPMRTATGSICVTAPEGAKRPMGALLAIADPGGGMNAAVRAGIDTACRAGATTAIVLPADIPLVRAADIAALLDAAGDAPRATVLAASRDGRGTNAMLLHPPDAIAPAFGEPSLDRHAAAARAANCHTVVLHNLALALDVDTPEDLAALRSQPALPPHTAAALAHFRTTTNPRGD